MDVVNQAELAVNAFLQTLGGGLQSIMGIIGYNQNMQELA